ncbi:MAG: hypothetical protein ACRDH5_14055 [bacterium]
MRKVIVLLLVAALFTAVSLPALQSQPQQPPKEKKKPRKVWTEDDLAGLGGRINVVGAEAPPPAPPGQPAVPGAARPDDALWRELDDLHLERKEIQGQIDLNRRSVDSITAKLAGETDPVAIDDLLGLRVWQEEQVVLWEEELERVTARIAELEKLTAGRKRPPRPAPVKIEKVRPAPAEEGEGEAPPEPPGEEPPEEESPEEEPPPPPPAS